jgi:hypothetical protein
MNTDLEGRSSYSNTKKPIRATLTKRDGYNSESKPKQ